MNTTFNRNREDFEKAVAAAQKSMESLYGVINDDLYNSIDNALCEYDGHFKSDIDDLIEECEDLEARLWEAEND